MQLIRDIYAAKKLAKRPVISFEFFPPKTDEGDRNLLEKTLPALKETNPDFCSVTYGAGGSTRDKTLMIVDRIQKTGVTALAHLTWAVCVFCFILTTLIIPTRTNFRRKLRSHRATSRPVAPDP